MTDRVSVVVLESQEVFAAGLVSLLASRMRTHTVASLDEAAAVLAADPAARLAIFDIAAPGVSGSDSIAQLRQHFPDLRIIVSIAQLSRAAILHGLGLGVHGVVCRAQPALEIAAAIRVVMTGGIFVPPSVSELPTAQGPALPRTGADTESRDPAVAAPPAARTRVELSVRQEAVLRLLRLGLSNKQIARELGLAEGTVKVHLAALYRILQVRNRAGAAASGLPPEKWSSLR